MINWKYDLDNFLSIYYSMKTMEHVKRVTDLAMSNPFASLLDNIILHTVCRCHDLLEDTPITSSQLKEILSKFIGEDRAIIAMNAIEIITHDKTIESYLDYIERIRYEHSDPYAYLAKLSDMKDHLLQKKTLTDKKKEKYDKAIPELL